jgi:hypothetical protein
MKLVFSISLLLILSNTFAENLVCTLQSGAEKTSVVAPFAELEEGYGEFFDENGVQDLSFDMVLECSEKTCVADIIIYSQILEDEAGSTGFEFSSTPSSKGKVFTDKITNTPDGKDYTLYCYYNR